MTKHGIMTIATAMAMGVAATAAAETKGPASMDGESPAMEEQPPAAEEMPPPAPAYTPPTDTGIQPVPKAARWAPASRIGMAVMGGGGVTNFTGDTASNATGVGGSWDVRFAVATRRWVGFEASYIGGSNGINNLLAVNNVDNNARLNRNGLEGALRINAPLYAKNTLLSPYILGGVGWNSYRVSNYNAVTSSVAFSGNTDNTISVPVATGFAVGYKGFIADVRYTFRPTFEQQILLNGSNSTLTNWDAGAMLGYEF